MRRRKNADFEQIVRNHQAAVTAFARSYVRNESSVDDIVQETFIRVWRYLPSYRNEGSFEGWIIRICRNVAYDYMRKNQSQPEISEELEAPVSHSDIQTDVMAAIAQLSDDHRQVITLCLVLGYPYDEAADILGIPIGTVRSRVSRAREILQDQLAEDYMPHRKLA